jgi:hypothetical protein
VVASRLRQSSHLRQRRHVVLPSEKSALTLEGPPGVIFVDNFLPESRGCRMAGIAEHDGLDPDLAFADLPRLELEQLLAELTGRAQDVSVLRAGCALCSKQTMRSWAI